MKTRNSASRQGYHHLKQESKNLFPVAMAVKIVNLTGNKVKKSTALLPLGMQSQLGKMTDWQNTKKFNRETLEVRET